MKFGHVLPEPLKNIKIELEPDQGIEDHSPNFAGFKMNEHEDEISEKDDKNSEETKNNKRLKEKEEKKALKLILKEEIKKLQEKERSEKSEEKKTRTSKETCEEIKEQKTKKNALSKKIKKVGKVTKQKLIGRPPKNGRKKCAIRKDKNIPKVKKYKRRLNKKNVTEAILIESCSSQQNKNLIYEGSDENEESQNCKKRSKTITETHRNHFEDGVVEIFYDNGDRYKGKVNEKNNFHDENGEYYTKDYEYKGNWENGKTKGPGATKYYCPYAYEEGIYEQGYKRFGKGKDEYANGETYEGEFVNEEKSGRGIYRFKNNDCEYYEGEFKKNKQDGKGMEVFLNGDTYEGYWKQDERDGEGIFTCSTHKEKQVYKKGKLISSHILDSTDVINE